MRYARLRAVTALFATAVLALVTIPAGPAAAQGSSTTTPAPPGEPARVAIDDSRTGRVMPVSWLASSDRWPDAFALRLRDPAAAASGVGLALVRGAPDGRQVRVEVQVAGGQATATAPVEVPAGTPLGPPRGVALDPDGTLHVELPSNEERPPGVTTRDQVWVEALPPEPRRTRPVGVAQLGARSNVLAGATFGCSEDGCRQAPASPMPQGPSLRIDDTAVVLVYDEPLPTEVAGVPVRSVVDAVILRPGGPQGSDVVSFRVDGSGTMRAYRGEDDSPVVRRKESGDGGSSIWTKAVGTPGPDVVVRLGRAQVQNVLDIVIGPTAYAATTRTITLVDGKQLVGVSVEGRLGLWPADFDPKTTEDDGEAPSRNRSRDRATTVLGMSVPMFGLAAVGALVVAAAVGWVILRRTRWYRKRTARRRVHRERRRRRKSGEAGADDAAVPGDEPAPEGGPDGPDVPD